MPIYKTHQAFSKLSSSLVVFFLFSQHFLYFCLFTYAQQVQRTEWSTYLIKWTFQFPWRTSDPLAAAKEPSPWCTGMLSYIQINTSPHNPGQQHCCFLVSFCVIERYFRIRKVVNKTKHALTHRLYKKLSLQFWLEIIYVEIKCALVTSLFLNMLLWHVKALILTYNVIREADTDFFLKKNLYRVWEQRQHFQTVKHGCAVPVLYISDSCSVGRLTAGISRAGTLLPLTSCSFAKHMKGKEWNNLHFPKKQIVTTVPSGRTTIWYK